jgi:serine/threonine protein kinase
MDLENIKVLGKGSFGQVWQARHKKTGKIYAIKEIKKKSVNSSKLL